MHTVIPNKLQMSMNIKGEQKGVMFIINGPLVWSSMQTYGNEREEGRRGDGVHIEGSEQRE